MPFELVRLSSVVQTLASVIRAKAPNATFLVLVCVALVVRVAKYRRVVATQQTVHAAAVVVVVVVNDSRQKNREAPAV